MADPGRSGGDPEYLRMARSQLDSVENHCGTARRQLDELRGQLADTEGAAARDAVVRALDEEPELAASCRAIRTNTFDALDRQLSKLVVSTPGAANDLSAGGIDEAMIEMGQHHDRLMEAVKRLDGIARAERFDAAAARRAVDEGVRATRHIDSTVEHVRCLLAKAVPGPAEQTGDGSAVESADPEFVVTGTVTQDGEALAGVTVRAFDRDLGGREPLGEATTGTNGDYRIPYRQTDFQRAERGTADVYVRVLNAAGGRLAESDVVFNVGQEATIDVTVDPGVETTPSEYALLRSELEPLLDGRAVATLDDDELSFLAAEIEVSDRAAYPADGASLQYLANAARVANQTPVSEPVAYAIARQTGRTWGSDELAGADPETLVDHVRTAVDAGVLAAEPEGLERRLRRAVEAISTTSRPKVEGRARQVAIPSVVDAETGRPLSGYTVEVIDAHDADVAIEHGRSVTDQNGGFGFSYLVPPATDADETDDGTSDDDSTGDGQVAGAQERTFDVRVSKDGRTVGTDELTLDDGTTGTTEVRSATPGKGSATPIGTLSETTDLGLSDTGVSRAGELTFDDIRAAGGIDGTGVQVPEEDAARLDSLTELTMVAPPDTAARLYEAGYDSHLAIARTPPGKFRQDLSGDLSPTELERVRARAVAGADLLDELLLEHRIALASEGDNGRVAPEVDAEQAPDREAADAGRPSTEGGS